MFTGTYVQHSTPFAVPGVTTQTADDALDTVLDFGGADWWNRTSTVTRIVSPVHSAGTTGALITNPAEVGGWPSEPVLYRPANWDTDNDGMPDEWEQQHGLKPAVANHNSDFDADGYTDVEAYLNELAAWPAPQPIVFNGVTNGRYAQITHWDIPFQPSKYDTAVIDNGTVAVDAVGQHAGNLILGMNSDDNARLDVTAGWIKVEDAPYGMSDGITVIGDDPDATATLHLSGGKLTT